MSPAISVVITSFNDGRFLTRALESVRAQTLADWEAVICDDGSTDGTSVQAAQALAGERVKVVLHPTNRGLAAARNTAIKAAQGRIVVPLDADDRLPTTALSDIFRAFADSSVDFAYGHTLEVAWENGAQTLYKSKNGAEFGANGWIPWCGCSPFSRSLWERLGGYDESDLFRHAPEDFDFWLRVSTIGARGQLIDSLLYEYIRRPNTLGAEFTPQWVAGVFQSLSRPAARNLARPLRRRVVLHTCLAGAVYWRRRRKPLAALGPLFMGLRAFPLSLRLWKAALGCLVEWLIPPLQKRYSEPFEARHRQATSHTA